MKIEKLVNSINAQGGLNGNYPTEASSTDFKEAVRLCLMANLPMTDEIAMKCFGSSPFYNNYFAFIPLELKKSIESLEDFISIHNYTVREGNPRNELGSMPNVRVIVKQDHLRKFQISLTNQKSNKQYRIIFMPIESDEGLILCCNDIERAKYYDQRIELWVTNQFEEKNENPTRTNQ